MNNLFFISSRFLLGTALLGLLAVGQGCSVKEDRGPCPTVLTVRGEGGEVTAEAALLWADSEGVKGVDSEGGTLSGAGITAKVAKGVVDIIASMGISTDSVDDSLRYWVAYGEQADSLYVFRGTYDVQGEFYEVTGKLNREFIPLSFTVSTEDPMLLGCSEVVRSLWSGLDLVTMEPLRGDFSYDAGLVCGGEKTVQVIRQADDSMTLDIVDPEGEVIYTIPLGELMHQTGYVFGANSLLPVEITIELLSAEMKITVRDWDRVMIFTIVI